MPVRSCVCKELSIGWPSCAPTSAERPDVARALPLPHFYDTGTVTWSGLSGNDVATPGSCHFQDELLIARHGADIIRYPEKDDSNMAPFLQLAGTWRGGPVPGGPVPGGRVPGGRVPGGGVTA